MPDANPPTRAPRRIRRAHRWLFWSAVALVVVASVVVVFALGLARMAPPWWRTIRAEDPATRLAAETIENDIVNAAYRVRPEEGAVWAVALRARDANAWLNTRFAQWLTNTDAEFEWPDQLSDLQVEFDEDRVHVGVSVHDGERTQVVSATIRPEVRDDGSLWVPVESAYLGRLPIPSGWMVGQAGESLPEGLPARLLEDPVVRELFAALGGDAPLRDDPVLDLGDGRRVRLLAVNAEAGALRVVCRTELTP